MVCNMQFKCKTCFADGVEKNVCKECYYPFDKLVNGKCVCNAIANCDECSDAKTCVKCSGLNLINKAVIPNTCVAKCPANTH